MSIGQRAAIIDIGSNSVRLVVYGGPARAPFALYNEKLLAGLGKGLAEGGSLAKPAMKASLSALARFRHLLNMMGVTDIQVVATAAVREARNGESFLQSVAALGFAPRVLTGEEEAVAAGYGVISSIPEADGIAGDLGGGSLELVRISKGAVQDKVSLPLGSLKIPALRAAGPRALHQALTKLLRGHEAWLGEAEGLPFYMVGGSWRTLARVHMHRIGYPLPILSSYELAPEAAGQMVRMTAKMDKSIAKDIPSISSSRVAGLNDSAALLAALVRHLKPSQLVTCANGLREGLLFQRLSEAQRRTDPLLEEARAEGDRQGRFEEHGRLIHNWIKPLFLEESPQDARLRHAACLLGDVAWQANPEFRAERGVDLALHGAWTGASHRDRAVLAMALHATFGGGETVPHPIAQLVSSQDMKMAKSWGLAIRLAQRLSGGTAEALQHSALACSGAQIVLRVAPSHAVLASDQVARRLKSLATHMGLTGAVDVSPAN